MIQKNIQEDLEKKIRKDIDFLTKRDHRPADDIIADINELTKIKPEFVYEHLHKCTELITNGLEGASVSFLKGGLQLIKNNAEDRLNQYFDYGMEIHTPGRTTTTASYFEFSVKLFLQAPQNVPEYVRIGKEAMSIGEDLSKGVFNPFIAGDFFHHGVDVAITHPEILPEYVKHALRVEALDINTEPYLEGAAQVIANNPKNLRSYVAAGLRILRKETVMCSKEHKSKSKNEFGASPEASRTYFLSAPEVITVDPTKLKIYVDQGLKLLDECSYDRGVTRYFFWYAPTVVLKDIELIDKFVNEGKYIEPKIFLGYENYFASLSKIIRRRENRINEYITQIHKITDTITSEDTGEGDAIKSLIKNAADIIIKTDMLEKYVNYGAKIIDKSANAAYIYFEKAKDVLLNHPEIFDNFVNDGIKILNKSKTAAIKYFSDYEAEKIGKGFSTETIKTLVKRSNKYLSTKYRKKTCIVPAVFSAGFSVDAKAFFILEELIQKLGGFVDKDSNIKVEYFSERFWNETTPNTFKLANQIKYPIISELLMGKKFPTINEYRVDTYGNSMANIFSDNRPSKIVRSCYTELKEYFEKDNKLSIPSMNEFKDLIAMYYNYELEDYVSFEFDKKINTFFTKTNDCMSPLGKYAKEAVALIKNSYSAILSVNAIGYDGKTKASVGRAITNCAMINGKKVLYVAGMSGDKELSLVPDWTKEVYEGIMSILSENKDKIDGVFFDLNPRNSSRTSNEFAEYVAKRIGLVEGVDYTYKERSLGNSSRKTSRRGMIFELKQAHQHWTQLTILRDEGLEGKFFLESVMQEPKNKDIGPGSKPDLVYDQGWVIGKYIEI